MLWLLAAISERRSSDIMYLLPNFDGIHTFRSYARPLGHYGILMFLYI